jgi:hypothetical protein
LDQLLELLGVVGEEEDDVAEVGLDESIEGVVLLVVLKENSDKGDCFEDIGQQFFCYLLLEDAVELSYIQIGLFVHFGGYEAFGELYVELAEELGVYVFGEVD